MAKRKSGPDEVANKKQRHDRKNSTAIAASSFFFYHNLPTDVVRFSHQMQVFDFYSSGVRSQVLNDIFNPLLVLTPSNIYQINRDVISIIVQYSHSLYFLP